MRRAGRVLLFLLLAASVVSAEPLSPPIANWAAPATWSPATAGPGGGRHALTDATSPLPFIGITPCRVIDTRGNGFTGQYGPPAMPGGGAQRSFTIGGQCGVPASAAAVSFNFTVWAPVARGDIRTFPEGAATPTVSTLNWEANILAEANAAVVPLGTSNGITVQVDGTGTINLLVDINGYYGSTPANQSNWFELDNRSGSWTILANNSDASCSGECGIIANTAGGWALAGVSFNSYGVYGESHTGGDGVYGTNDDGSAAGVHGYLAANVGGSHAVFGEHASTTGNGIGVEGKQAGTGWGVYGHTDGDGLGVYGRSSLIGVEGYSGSSYGVGTYGRAASLIGVEGDSFGTAANSHGVYGYTASTAINGAGIFGTDGQGISGSTTLGSAGVRGIGQIGVVGVSSGTFGGGVVGVALSPATTGVGAIGDITATGTKSFIEPHPTDPSLTIRYVSLEGPEAGTYFRGTAQIRSGQAVIEVPESFRIVTDSEGLTVQLTPIGRTRIWVESEDLNRIVVGSDENVTFHYLVQGVRRAFKGLQAIRPGTEFIPLSADQKMPSNLTEEAKSRLISNGTYNPDGTVNMATAERMGWTRMWEEQKAEAEARARANAEARAAADRESQGSR